MRNSLMQNRTRAGFDQNLEGSHFNMATTLLDTNSKPDYNDGSYIPDPNNFEVSPVMAHAHHLQIL